MNIDPKVDEAIETLNMKDGPTRRRLLSGAGLVSASAAAAGLLAACSSSAPAARPRTRRATSRRRPTWQFWYVNHVTTNPFFVPTQYGFQDAAALLGLPTPKWGGSQNSLASEMVSYFNTAISAKAAGIAYAVIDATSFTTPVKNAMNAGIPVLSYNADGLVKKGVPDIGTNRLAYVGQALYISGQAAGPPDQVAGPGRWRHRHLHRHARVRQHPAPLRRCGLGARQLLHRARGGHRGGDRRRAVRGEGVPDRAQDNQGRVRGGRGLDPDYLGAIVVLDRPARSRTAGSTPTPTTLSNIQAGKTNFTIYQDPYLQGFLPTLYFYLFNLSGGTVSPPDTDTGLTFITKSNVKPFTASSRFQGSTHAQKYIPRASGAISNPLATTST